MSCRSTTPLGISNRRYPAAIDTAQELRIAGYDVRIVTPARFVATKLEAFHGRGGNDFPTSHDLEDIIALADGRPEIVDDVQAAHEQVRAYIASEISTLLGAPDFVEALPGFPLPDAASQARLSIVEGRLLARARLGAGRSIDAPDAP